MNQLRHNNQSGFTLVEVLITSFIFSIIMLSVSGLFISILANERRAFAAQAIQENGLFIMELMSREIRVSQIRAADQNPPGDSPGCTLTSLTIDHPVNGTVTYSLNGSTGVLQRTAGGFTSDLTSSTVSFSRLNFCLLGSDPTDQKQVRVAILASVRNKTGKDILTFNLETAVTSRNLESEFTR